MPKQRPIEERISEMELRLRMLKQQKKVEEEWKKLREMKPRRKMTKRA